MTLSRLLPLTALGLSALGLAACGGSSSGGGSSSSSTSSSSGDGGAGGGASASASSGSGGGDGGASSSAGSSSGGGEASSSVGASTGSAGGGGVGGAASSASSSSSGGLTCASLDCGANGTCDDSSGAAVCACSPGFGGATCGSCVRFVDPGATGTGDGLTWKNALASPRLGVASATAATLDAAGTCEVWIREGTYYLYRGVGYDPISVAGGVGVYGGFTGTEADRSAADPALHPTILSGLGSATGTDHVGPIIDMGGASASTLDGLVLRDGAATDSAPAGGGAVHVAQNAVISRCELTGNSSTSYGGAIAAHASPFTLTVVDSSLHDNTAAGDGGGLWCAGGCVVTRTTLRNNTAGGSGGGLALINAQGAVSDSTFAGNQARLDGGGAHVESQGNHADATFTNVLFDGCATLNGDGGGLALASDTLGAALTSVIFSGNYANDDGGGLSDGSTHGASLESCVLHGNDGDGDGPALAWSGGAPRLSDTIVWGNRPGGSAEPSIYPNDWTTIVTSHSDLAGFTGTDATSFDLDPKLASVPVFFDWSAGDGGLVTIDVQRPAGFHVGDVIEIRGDGVSRTISAISGDELTFAPALAAPVPASSLVRNWGTALRALSYELAAGSPCIDKGDAAAAPAEDFSGQPRVGAPDIGALEYH